MRLRYPNSIFSKFSFSLSKEDVKKIASIVEKLVFQTEDHENPNQLEYKKFILQKWLSLCQSYTTFPSLTASMKILRHYHNNSDFKDDLEDIMKFSMNSEESLEKSVAFAILNLSNAEEIKTFKSFFNAFNEFLTRVDKKGKAMKLFFIATFIVKKLAVHINENETENRLLILDFVKTITEELGGHIKIKLKEFLPKDLKPLKLNAKEQKQFQTFVEYLDKQN